jgi:hypothetical protein
LIKDQVLSKNIEQILEYYLQYGFKPEKYNENLQKVVLDYYNEHKDAILTASYYMGLHNYVNWNRRKLPYILYKYELVNTSFEVKIDIPELRKYMKNNTSIDHIVPQQYSEIIKDEKGDLILNENGIDELNSVLHGIGNLIIINSSQNSSHGNEKPNLKTYKNMGGSYSEHNINSVNWVDPKGWVKLINERSEKIYEFIADYFLKDNIDVD